MLAKATFQSLSGNIALQSEQNTFLIGPGFGYRPSITQQPPYVSQASSYPQPMTSHHQQQPYPSNQQYPPVSQGIPPPNTIGNSCVSLKGYSCSFFMKGLLSGEELSPIVVGLLVVKVVYVLAFLLVDIELIK